MKKMIKNIKPKSHGYLLTAVFLLASSCVHGEKGDEFFRFSECPDSPNCVSSEAEPSDSQHYIKPYKLSGTSQDVYNKLISYLEQRKNVEIVEIENNVYIHAVFISSFMRFKDDVEFRFSESAGGNLEIDIASRSRTGYSDLGVNRKRMEEIREFLSSE